MRVLVLLGLLAVLSGCTAFNTLGDYINENEVLTSIAARQAVAHYIAAGDTIEAENKRAKQIETRLERIAHYIDGNPKATSDSLLALVNASIDWGELERADKLLVEDIMTLLEKELKQYDSGGGLSESSRIALRGLFDTAISAARIYLSRS